MGDKIQCSTNHPRKVLFQHRVIDFVSNEIVVSSSGETIHKVLFDVMDFHRIDSGPDEESEDTLTPMKPFDSIWVKRNPTKSRQMILTEPASAESLTSSTALAIAKMWKSKRRGKKKKRKTTYEVLGEGTDLDFEWTKLTEVPPLKLNWTAGRLVQELCNDKIKCYCCKKDLPVPFRGFVGWHSISKEKATKIKTSAAIQHFRDNHPGQIPWQVGNIAYRFLEGDKFEVKDRIQRCLQQAVNNIPLPIGYVETFVTTNHNIPLMNHLSQMFGFAIGCCIFGAGTVNRLQCHKKIPETQMDTKKKSRLIRCLNTKALEILHSMVKAFLSFDYKVILRFYDLQGKTAEEKTYLLWNAFNLFFARGMYMKDPFIPIMHMEPIPSMAVLD